LDFSKAKNTGDAGHPALACARSYKGERKKVFLTPQKFKRYIGKCRSYSLGVTY
jgi:hypothetical protein